METYYEPTASELCGALRRTMRELVYTCKFKSGWSLEIYIGSKVIR